MAKTRKLDEKANPVHFFVSFPILDAAFMSQHLGTENSNVVENIRHFLPKLSSKGRKFEKDMKKWIDAFGSDKDS